MQPSRDIQTMRLEIKLVLKTVSQRFQENREIFELLDRTQELF